MPLFKYKEPRGALGKNLCRGYAGRKARNGDQPKGIPHQSVKDVPTPVYQSMDGLHAGRKRPLASNQQVPLPHIMVVKKPDDTPKVSLFGVGVWDFRSVKKHTFQKFETFQKTRGASLGCPSAFVEEVLRICYGYKCTTLGKSKKKEKRYHGSTRGERIFFCFLSTRENERTPLPRSEFPLRLADCVLTRIIFGNS